MTSELCEGSLHTVMATIQRPLRESEAIAALWQGLLALQFLHSKNFVHMNVSTASLLLTPLGELKLADFIYWCVAHNKKKRLRD